MPNAPLQLDYAGRATGGRVDISDGPDGVTVVAKPTNLRRVRAATALFICCCFIVPWFIVVGMEVADWLVSQSHRLAAEDRAFLFAWPLGVVLFVAFALQDLRRI